MPLPSNVMRAVIACGAMVAVPLIASCSATAGASDASVASVPTSANTASPAPTPVITSAPAIGDACVIGTWRLVKGTIVVNVLTKNGSVVAVTATGGAGELEHLSSGGTYVYDEGGTSYVGSAHGYRVVVRPAGVLRATVIFLNGNENLEPIDASGDHTTVSINGGPAQRSTDAGSESFTYTCAGNTFTSTRSGTASYTYQRVSSTP
jgi:hypothetical protein